MSRLSTKHVVLGLLIERPGYGYDIGKRLEARLGFLGFAEGAVYKALERLEREGLAEEHGEKKIGRTRRGAPRVMYRATPRGIDRFRTWMDEPCTVATSRDPFNVKLALAQQKDVRRVIELAETQANECLAQLATLTRPSLATAALPDVPLSVAAAMMLDDRQVRELQSKIDWLNAVCEILEARVEHADPKPA